MTSLQQQPVDETIGSESLGKERASSSSAVRRVASILRERILSGQYAPGEWLPAERDLTDELRVHRRIVRAASVLLANEELLVRRTNCRPVVNVPAGVRKSAEDGLVDEDVAAVGPASKTIALLTWQGGSVFESEGTAKDRTMKGLLSRLLEETEMGVLRAQFLDLEHVGTEEENAAREAFNLSYALRRGYAGIVFYPYATESNQPAIRAAARRVPFVLIDRRLAGVEADFVGIQNLAAIYEATRRLIELGHKRIAFLTLPQNIHTVHDRLRGYLRAMKEAFGEERQEWILTAPDDDAKSWPAFNAIFSLPASKRPTAAVCVNDYMALRVTDRLDDLGLRVPVDISVTGFDDIVKKLPNGVALATVAQPYEELGRAAADLLLRRMEKPLIEHSDIEIPCRFVERDSIRAI